MRTHEFSIARNLQKNQNFEKSEKAAPKSSRLFEEFRDQDKKALIIENLKLKNNLLEAKEIIENMSSRYNDQKEKNQNMSIQVFLLGLEVSRQCQILADISKNNGILCIRDWKARGNNRGYRRGCGGAGYYKYPKRYPQS